MSAASRRAVFFDRDGVLNEAIVRDGKPYSPANLQEVVIPQDARAAMQRLKEAGFVLLGVTNQPDVARGVQRQEIVEAINTTILGRLPLERFFVCYHDDRDGCDCRKPRPGLLLQAAAEYGIDLARSFMIGDRWRDVEAGRRAGCQTVHLVGRHTEEVGGPPDYTAHSLSDAASWILCQSTARGGVR
jgi:D-glycero-D-manno-heptose 1,7-bisphosphate phosphatase